MLALVRAVASDKAPLTLLQVDQKALKQYAQSTRGTMEVPGVVFEEKSSIRVRV